MARWFSTALALLSVAVLIGCASVATVPEGKTLGDADAEAAWGRVLAANVDDQGRVHFYNVDKSPADLNDYVRYVANAKTSGWDKQRLLAFYLNAYNALSMYNVLHTGHPSSLDGTLKQASFFFLRKYSFAGEVLSLYSFENEKVRKLGDPRVHVALNCMSAGCPRLPREPFRAATLEAQLEREAKKFYNEERNVRLDEKTKTMHVSEILRFFTADFLAVSPSLVDYVNRYRTVKVPKDYAVAFIPYDWTVWRQPGSPPGNPPGAGGK